MSAPPAHRYPEKTLQLTAIKWLKDHRGYREEYADEEARGARVDSVGLLEGRLALIEVKVTVGANVVEHAADRAHSLEAKIAGTLGPLYRREHNRSPLLRIGSGIGVARHWSASSRGPSVPMGFPPYQPC
jgi:hypothetical protein